MNGLPSGTVTFLFTDIEGSTKLAQEFPDEMPVLLARHNEILNQAIQAHAGFVFQIAGDSFSAAFHTVNDAVNAVMDAQRLLHKEAWSPAPIKVRMGIHTGAAQLQDALEDSRYSNYATLALSQRVMSAGHGGQILISQTVHDLLSSDLPEEIELVDMGEHYLKDVLRPTHLYQLKVAGLASEFPPLKTLKTTNHNLPTNLTSFIGRERELREIKAKLEGARLLTLIGPGGTGKTRLSLQTGAEMLPAFSDGIWMVELAPLADPTLIVQTIAAVFGLRESPERALTDLVMDYLRAKRMLLILDNCEHLIEACAQVADQLLHSCPSLKIVASSREALGIHGETVYRVPSLYLPDPTRVTREALLRCESVQLFAERASAANPNFQLTERNAPSVAQICLRLDGIPLALELAAARVRVLSVEQITERLDDRFRLLTGGSRTALPRQQTLQALIDWSYDLLTEPERALFRRLAVFVGGWTLEAAETVCSDNGIETYEVLDLLTELVDKSLVMAEERDGTVRYYRLATIRQYAREKLLQTDEALKLRNRHLDYFIELANWSDENYFGPEQKEVEKRLIAESDNIRSALSWASESQPEKALELVSWVVMFALWMTRGYITEARNWCQRILSRLDMLPPAPGESAEKRLRLEAGGWDRLSIALMNLGDHHAGQAAAEKSAALARETGDQQQLAEALASLGIGVLYSGDPEHALEVTKESIEICKRMGYQRELAWATNTLIHIYNFKGDQAQAQKYNDEYKSLLQKAGVPVNPAETEMDLAEGDFQRGDMAGSLNHVQTALALLAEQGDKYRLTIFQSNTAHFLRQHGELAKALNFYRETIRLWQDFGHRAAVAHQLECFALIAMAQDQLARAARLFSAANMLRGISASVRTITEQKEFDEAKAQLQLQMDDEEFNSLWNAGKSLSMEQAIKLALDEY